MTADSISFPHLHLFFRHVGDSIQIGGLRIAFYGMIVAAAMLAGVYLVMWLAKKTGQDPDVYFNFAMIAIILSVIGARLYYVVFSWDYYSSRPLEIFDLRGGGLAIYGGVITGVASAVIYSRIKKIPVSRFVDTAAPALLLGQAVGRWGNFFNREAFGEYTDSLLAMRLPLEAVQMQDVTAKMTEHAVDVDGVACIQVHPMFLYESLWNFCLLLVLLTCLGVLGGKRTAGQTDARDKKTAAEQTAADAKAGKPVPDGTVFWLYLGGYALGRVWMEGLRTDQLRWPGTGIAVSQALAAVLLAVSIVMLIRKAVL